MNVAAHPSTMLGTGFPIHSEAAPPHNPLPFSRRRSPVPPLERGSPAGEAPSRPTAPLLEASRAQAAEGDSATRLPAVIGDPAAGEAGEPAASGGGGSTFAGVPVAAFETMMIRRQRQIAEYGHTPANDLALRPTVLPSRAERAIVNALEDMQFQRTDDWRQRAMIHLADAGAFCAAAFDYLASGGRGR